MITLGPPLDVPTETKLIDYETRPESRWTEDLPMLNFQLATHSLDHSLDFNLDLMQVPR